MPRSSAAALALLLALSFGCAATNAGVPDAGGGSADAGPSSSMDASPTSFDAGTVTFPDAGPLADAGGEVCQTISAEAESVYSPVDIVWIIDNSGSMSEEAELVQNNLNTFAATIEAAGIDVRVVLITVAGFAEIPAPLGTDPERFLRVDESVASHDSFDVLLDTMSTWQPFLRPEASLHLVSTTDDAAGGWSWERWNDEFSPRLGHRPYFFHSISSPPGTTHRTGPFTLPGCVGPHGDAQGNGDEYWGLSQHTGGQQFSICTEDWSDLFDNLAEAVAIPQALPCFFGIPEAPAGESFDPSLVNVDYTRGGDGLVIRLPRAANTDACAGRHGWFFDADDPADANHIVLCPATCTQIEADEDAEIDMAFGCEALLI